MPQQINQRVVPLGSDEPKRAWFDEYARSDRGVLEFATLAAANTWVTDPANSSFAVDGRHAWITAEKATYELVGGAWRPSWQEIAITWIANRYSPAGFARPRLLAQGRTRILTAGAIGSAVAFTQPNLLLGTIPAGHRPAETIRAAASSQVGDCMTELTPAGALSYVWWATVTMAANTYAVTTTLVWTVAP